MAGNHNCSYAGVLQRSDVAYKCESMKKKKKQRHSTCLEWVDAFAHRCMRLSRNFWSHACIYVNRNEYTELSEQEKKKNGVTAIWFRQSLLRIHLARSQDCLCCNFFFTFRSISVHSERMGDDRWSAINGESLLCVDKLQCVDLASLHRHVHWQRRKFSHCW